MKHGSNIFKSLFQSKFFLAFLVVLTIVSGLRLASEIQRRSKINSEIHNLKERIVRLQSEQKGLKGIVDYFQTDIYLEEQVRKKLSLRKPGETIVIVTEPDTYTIREAKHDDAAILWWNYFFSYD